MQTMDTHCVLTSYYTVLRDSDLNNVGALSRYLFVLQHHVVRRSELFIFPHYLAMVKTSPGNCKKSSGNCKNPETVIHSAL